jgi:hypothetical protein
MGTRVLLAGAENPQLMGFLLECKSRFILLSYYYIRKKWGKDLNALKEILKNFEFVMIDSGAFTLFKGEITYEKIEKYAYDYTQFLQDFKPYISCAVELDLYEIEQVGLRSHEIREKILSQAGVPIIPVYHGDLMPINKQNRNDFIKLCGEYKYVGMASALHQKGVSNLTGLVTEAAKHETVVHAFGITRQDFIKNGRFYSADSTAWTNGQRFGTHYIFENNKIRIYSNLYKERARKRFKKRWERAGLPLDGLEKDQIDTFTRINCWEWVQFQNWCFNQSNRDYWDSSKELNPERIGRPIVVMERTVNKNDISYDIEDGEEFPEKMIPGEEPYTEEGRKKLQRLVSDAADEDPGEEQEGEFIKRSTEFNTYEEFFNNVQDNIRYKVTDTKYRAAWLSVFTRKDKDCILDSANKEHPKKEYILYRSLDDDRMNVVDRDYNKYFREIFKDKGILIVNADTMEHTEVAIRDEKDKLSFSSIAESNPLRCVDCYIAGRCAQYKADSYCSYTIPATIKGPQDMANHLSKMLEIQFDRVFKGALVEKLDGGVLDKTVSEEMMRTMRMCRDFKDIFTEKNEIVIKAQGKQGTGILGSLFGDLKGDKKGE